LRTEAGLLAADISDAMGPRSKEAADQKADRDVKKFLTDRPEYSNLEESQQYSSSSDFTWLAAGPQFLLGINDEDNQLGASAEDAIGFYRAGQKYGSRGRARELIGSRGKQKIYRINRTRVSGSALRSVVSQVKDRFGILRASFAATSRELLPNKRFPKWVEKWIASRADGRSIFRDEGLNHPTEPYLEFGSTAAGVESNPYLVEKISGAVEKRKFTLAAKLKKVISGYCYDWNTGRVFKRREAMEEEG
jgi:hypothetical protein